MSYVALAVDFIFVFAKNISTDRVQRLAAKYGNISTPMPKLNCCWVKATEVDKYGSLSHKSTNSNHELFIFSRQPLIGTGQSDNLPHMAGRPPSVPLYKVPDFLEGIISWLGKIKRSPCDSSLVGDTPCPKAIYLSVRPLPRVFFRGFSCKSLEHPSEVCPSHTSDSMPW